VCDDQVDPPLFGVMLNVTKVGLATLDQVCRHIILMLPQTEAWDGPFIVLELFTDHAGRVCLVEFSQAIWPLCPKFSDRFHKNFPRFLFRWVYILTSFFISYFLLFFWKANVTVRCIKLWRTRLSYLV
jgi:hypothetical protein